MREVTGFEMGDLLNKALLLNVAIVLVSSMNYGAIQSVNHVFWEQIASAKLKRMVRFIIFAGFWLPFSFVLFLFIMYWYPIMVFYRLALAHVMISPCVILVPAGIVLWKTKSSGRNMIRSQYDLNRDRDYGSGSEVDLIADEDWSEATNEACDQLNRVERFTICFILLACRPWWLLLKSSGEL